MTLRGLEGSMKPIHVAAVLGTLLATTLVPLAEAAPTTFTVNVVSARSLGCSPDFFTSPDLRVRVLVGGVPVATTAEASDQSEPVFALTATASAQLPATIEVEVEEGEPSGFFGMQTTYVPCVVGPGGATRASFTYAGEAAKGVTIRGEGDRAAEAVLVVGTSPPPLPVVNATATTTEVTLRWAADPSGQATGHRVAHAGAGRIVQAAVSGTTATVSGLCDNTEHAFRVIRDTPTWRVSSADVRVKTANAAPQPPRVLSAERSGNVSFESPTTHDVARYEIHASSSAAFAPSDATLRKTITPFSISFSRTDATDVPFRQTDAYVVVRTVDTGALHADSASFGIGSAPRDATLGMTSACGASAAPAGGGGGSSTPPPPPSSGAGGTPPEEKEPCCYGFEMRGSVAFPVVPAGAKLDVTFESRSDLQQTLDVRLRDPTRPATAQNDTVLAIVTLAPRETRTVAIPVPTPSGAAVGALDLRLEAVVRESVDTRVGATLDFVLDVRPGARILAAFEVKERGLVVNGTPGGLVHVPLTLVNRGETDLTLRAEAPRPALRFDADVGASVRAHGFEPTLSFETTVVSALTADREHIATVRVPANATLGSLVTVEYALTVTDGEESVSVPFTLQVDVMADVAASADVDADVAGGVSAGASVGLVAAAAAGTALAAGAAVWAATRDAARYAIGVALYARLAKHEMLDHPQRKALQARIAAEPGICYSDLQRATGLATGPLVHHLRSLERAGIVASRREGAYRRFYAAGASPPVKEVLEVPVVTPMQARVLELVRETPLTQGELAERLALSQQTTSHHVKSLVRAGHLEAVFDGRVWRYRPVEQTEVAP